MPVVVGMSDAVIPIRSVVCADAGVSDASAAAIATA
jgi:hypothetical protein